MTLLSKVAVTVAGLAALVAAEGCAGSLPAQYITYRDAVENDKVVGYEIEFQLSEATGRVLVNPKGQVIQAMVRPPAAGRSVRGFTGIAPYLAISGCKPLVTQFQISPQGDLVKREENTEKAKQVESYLTQLYSELKIKDDCTTLLVPEGNKLK